MNKIEQKDRNIKALNVCINYWGKIFTSEIECTSGDGCELCTQYWNNGCKDCPIYIDTGYKRCENSPYEDFSEYVESTEFYEVTKKLMVCDHESRDLAGEMLKYLKTLMENEEEKVSTYKVGNKFSHRNDSYIIASVKNDTVLLVCMDDGCRWGGPMEVSDEDEITQEELDEIFNGFEFTLIK